MQVFLCLSLLVLEVCAVSGQGLGSEGRWQRVLQEDTLQELQAPLHRLAALQGVLWLAANRLATAEGLFQLLNGAKVANSSLELHSVCTEALLALPS